MFGSHRYLREPSATAFSAAGNWRAACVDGAEAWDVRLIGVGAESLVLGEGRSLRVERLVVLGTEREDVAAVDERLFPSALSFDEIFLEKRGLLGQLVIYRHNNFNLNYIPTIQLLHNTTHKGNSDNISIV